MSEHRIGAVQEREQRYQTLLLLIPSLLSEGKTEVLRRLVNAVLAPDLAQAFSELPLSEAIAVFRLLDAALAGETLDEIDDAELAAALLGSVNRETVRSLLDEMSDDELSRLMRDLDKPRAERFLNALLAEDADAVREMIKLVSGTAAARMTTAFMTLSESITVAQALDEIRIKGEEFETINYIYITDDAAVLKGVLSLRELLFAPREQVLGEVMTLMPLTISPDASEREAAQLIRRYDLLAIPVVDADAVIQGIITFDDALDILEEQGGAEIYRLAGLSQEDEGDLLLKLPILHAAKLRLPWLLICIGGGMLTGVVIKGFEDALAQVIILASFIPVLMDSAGNIGTQSLAIAVRGIAVGDLSRSDYFKQVRREGIAGFMLGLICGVVTGMMALFMAFAMQADINLALAVVLGMWGGMTFAALIGMLIPLMVHFFKADPAISSGPLITTVADVFTIFVYFSIASNVLNLV